MQAKLPKDVWLMIVGMAGKEDPRAIHQVFCLNKTFNRWMSQSSMASWRQIKPQICQTIRNEIKTYGENRNKNPFKCLAYKVAVDPVDVALRQILAFTRDQNFSTMTYLDLPEDSCIRQSLNEAKIANLTQLSPLELYILYLCEQERQTPNKVIKGIIQQIQHFVYQACTPGQRKAFRDHYRALTSLSTYCYRTKQGEEDRLVYVSTCESLRRFTPIEDKTILSNGG